jgi:hypothetical protein
LFLLLKIYSFEKITSQVLHRYMQLEMQDGTWSTITGSCTVVRDLKDLLLHSYFSIMDDLRFHAPPGGEPYEIRFVFSFQGCILLSGHGIFI